MGNSAQDHRFADDVWSALKDAYIAKGTVTGLRNGVPTTGEYDGYPAVRLSDSGQIFNALDVGGSSPLPADHIALRLPFQLDDVECDFSGFGLTVVQIILHELEHIEQLRLGAASSIPTPQLRKIADAELTRAQAWLDEYYSNTLEFNAHARMIAFALVQKYATAGRALPHYLEAGETPVWLRIENRITSTIISDPAHVNHNTIQVADFKNRLFADVKRELEAMAKGA